MGLNPLLSSYFRCEAYGGDVNTTFAFAPPMSRTHVAASRESPHTRRCGPSSYTSPARLTTGASGGNSSAPGSSPYGPPGYVAPAYGGSGAGPHLVEHVVEVVGEVLDVLAIERGDDRRLETAANLTHHLVAGTLGGHDAVDPVVEDRQRLHQLLELEGGAGRVRGLLLEERVEPLVTGNQTKAHGGLPGRSCDASAG